MNISTDYITIILDENFRFIFQVSPWVSFGTALIIITFIGYRFYESTLKADEMEIDEAEFGFGNHKIKFKPNLIDKQIAYQIWVELSTRKIGLEIDTENDVIYEIYNSWYEFFSVTRDLVKDIPVSKFQRKDTERIIRLSIDVLNIGLRPHLTKWQAKFRRWYEKQLDNDSNLALSPQDIQKKYPNFSELESEILAVNKRLINYRKKMYEIITNS